MNNLRLFSQRGIWLKGNTHIHSTASDGGQTFASLERMYGQAGFDFLFRTDHWVASAATNRPGNSRLLWLDGIELDGKDHGGNYYHVVCLGRFRGLKHEMGFVPALESARQQGGLLILAHPHRTGNTAEDALRWGFHGVEIYNHVCNWLNGKSSGLFHWDVMLKRNLATLGFASDDAHLRTEHPGWNGGWVKVKAAARTPKAILDALRAGDYYSSCGPDFVNISLSGTKLTVQTSPVQFIRLVGPNHCGTRAGSFDGTLITEATLDWHPEWQYAYVEIEDDQRRRAWTNNIKPATDCTDNTDEENKGRITGQFFIGEACCC